MAKIKKYNKLIRDKIPEILDKKGITYTVHQAASDGEYLARLIAKLQEEIDEFSRDANEEEMADILEVLESIFEARSFSKSDVEDVRLKKLAERGGFKKRLIPDQTEEQ